jgi:hypothetical protein
LEDRDAHVRPKAYCSNDTEYYDEFFPLESIEKFSHCVCVFEPLGLLIFHHNRNVQPKGHLEEDGRLEEVVGKVEVNDVERVA